MVEVDLESLVVGSCCLMQYRRSDIFVFAKIFKTNDNSPRPVFWRVEESAKRPERIPVYVKFNFQEVV